MTDKHTPGPWCVEDPMGPENLWIVEAGKQTYEWRCIAMVCGDDGDADEKQPILAREQQANARLISASPDLLEALRFFANIGIGENEDYRPQIRLPREAIVAARAAVDKATRPDVAAVTPR